MAIYYAGTDYDTAEDYMKLKFGFDNPAVPIEAGHLIKMSAIQDDNSQAGYMEMETSRTESYNRKRIGRYVGGSVSDLQNTSDFTNRTFTANGTDYKIIKLPLHLIL